MNQIMKIKLNLAKKLLRLSFELYQHIKVYNYEPIEISGRTIKGKREIKNRWDQISDVLKTYDAKSILDFGCAEGWFLRQAAKSFGCFALGIEADYLRYMRGETARLCDTAERVSAMKARLSTPDLVGLPKCDVVICLSVVHHIMYSEGIEEARKFVTALASRAEKAFIFEMGTSDEVSFTWSNKLPDMPHGQSDFIESFLQSCGLESLRQLCKTPGLNQDAVRLMYVGTPQRK